MRATRSTPSVRQLFTIDAVGAALTAVMLAVVLPSFEAHLGMPRQVLAPLSVVAVCFAVYSATCAARGAGPRLLLGIAAANASYCLCTLGLVAWFWDTLTPLGVAYFLGEIAVIVGLVVVEVVVALRPGTAP